VDEVARVIQKRSLGPAEPQGGRRRRRLLKNPATVAANVAEEVIVLFHGGQAFHLRHPIDIGVRHAGDVWVHEYAPLGICAYGSSATDSLRAFAEEFSSCWHWIAQERDSKLGADALRLKRKLLDLVAEVGPAREFVPC